MRERAEPTIEGCTSRPPSIAHTSASQRGRVSYLIGVADTKASMDNALALLTNSDDDQFVTTPRGSGSLATRPYSKSATTASTGVRLAAL